MYKDIRSESLSCMIWNFCQLHFTLKECVYLSASAWENLSRSTKSWLFHCTTLMYYKLHLWFVYQYKYEEAL